MSLTLMKRFAVTLVLAGIFFYLETSVLAEGIRYDSKGLRDPFFPLVSAEGIVSSPKFDSSDIRIEGIIFDPNGGSMVLINGEFYKEGDPVSGANIISIFRDRVILAMEDEEKTLWIREEIVNSGEEANGKDKLSKKP